jgi:hypothetical protein
MSSDELNKINAMEYNSLRTMLNERGNGNSDIYLISSNVLFQLRDLQ